VLLALEDLHWADRSTRAFLAFLGSSLCRERVLVVGTYRLDELHRRHPLRPLLAELERDAGVRRVTLPPLTRDEAGAALEDILGAPPAAALHANLYLRSEGNPLFMEELLASGLEGRPDALPTTLRDALMVRVERLSEAAQDVLRVLAVSQRVDHEMLAEVSDLGASELRGALREAVASHIVVADADGRYRFRHALLGEVVEDDLLPGERTELHRALAQAFERREPDAQIAAAIANHYAAAGDQPAALKAAVAAATAAARVHAHGEAGALLERALELWNHVPDAETLTGGDRVTLLRRAAEAYLAAGEHTRPEPLLRAAVELVDEQADPRRAAGLLERLAFAQWRSGSGESRALASARRALELVGDEPSPERAQILAWWAKTRMLQGRFSDAVRAAREAIDAAEAGGNPAARSGALNAMGVALAGQGAVEEGAAALRKAVEIAEEQGRPSELESAYINLADVLHLAGRSREALEVARKALDEAATRGYKTNWLSAVISELLTELGEWDEAERLLPELDRRMSGVYKATVELRRAELAMGRGQHELAAERLAGIEDMVLASSEPQWHGPFGCLTAELRRRQGDLDGARRAVDDALDRIEFCTEDVARLARVSAIGAAVEADRAQRGRDLADPEDVERAQSIMLGLLARVEAAAEGGGAVEEAWLAMAQADAARAEGSDDPERWAHAAEAWSAVERPYMRAVALWRRAEALSARDDREAAGASAAEALEITTRLGAGWLRGEVEGLIARARLRVEEDGVTVVVEHNGDEDPFGLTPRERQVLTLVARGATNREIGSELFMAEKTASVHVSRILAKLDVRSRTQAAAVAHRMGLAE
jgi:ATP/maltotriose-dependent transcriptional regulator MalT